MKKIYKLVYNSYNENYNYLKKERDILIGYFDCKPTDENEIKEILNSRLRYLRLNSNHINQLAYELSQGYTETNIVSRDWTPTSLQLIEYTVETFENVERTERH